MKKHELEHEDATPAYVRIRADLQDRIRRGDWPVGTSLPSRQQLAREYGVDLHTLQRAVSNLLEQGILVAEKGKRTFVAPIDGSTLAPPIDTPVLARKARNRIAKPVPEDDLLVMPSLLRRLMPGRKASVDANLAIVFPTTQVFLKILDKIPAGIIQSLWMRFEEDPWTTTIVTAAESAFSARGGSVRTYAYSYEEGDLIPTVQRAVHDGADIMISINLHQEISAEMARLIDHEPPIPMVIVTWKELDRPVPHVYYDQHYAGYEAAEHLLEQGCRRLVFFSTITAHWVEERIRGVRSAARLAGLDETAVIVAPKERRAPVNTAAESLEEPYTKALSVIEQLQLSGGTARKDDWGVVAVHDFDALGFWNAANARGLAMGIDYKLVAFDSSTPTSHIGITSLRPPLEEMGREAADQAADLLCGASIRWQTRLQSHLAVRPSTRPWKHLTSDEPASQ